MIASPSRSCSSVMISGGLQKIQFQRTKVLSPSSTRERATFAIGGVSGRLNGLIGSLHELLAGPAWQNSSSQLTAAVSEGRATLEGVIDRVFWRAIILVMVLVAALFLYRFLTQRLVAGSTRS